MRIIYLACVSVTISTGVMRVKFSIEKSHKFTNYLWIIYVLCTWLQCEMK
jgi:hypothetical protein